MFKSEDKEANTNNGNKFTAFNPAARQATKAGAKKAGAGAVSGSKAYTAHIKENGGLLKVLAVLAALALMVTSALGFAWVMNVMNPIWYIHNCINLCFAFIIIVVEGPSTWKWCGLRFRLFKNMGFLGSPIGRALFYVYVGIMVLGLVDYTGGNAIKILQWSMGGMFMGIGVCQILAHFQCCCFKPTMVEMVEGGEIEDDATAV